MIPLKLPAPSQTIFFSLSERSKYGLCISTPIDLLFSISGLSHTFIFSVRQGTIQLEYNERLSFGIILLLSKPNTFPKPPHPEQAPYGLLKLKRLSVGSINVMPSSSNLLEKSRVFTFGIVTVILPRPSKKPSLHTSIILKSKLSSPEDTTPLSIRTS